MPVKILSVDDEMDLELLLTQYFRRKIRKGEYEFVFAHNGLEALTMMLKHPDVEIILSDINMPEMDGLTLLAKINEMRNPALKVIMVSAYGDMGNIRQAMNNGAFDFATKPIDLDDLSVTIEKAIEQIDYVHKTQVEHQQLESLKTDLAVASEIQQAILPRVFPPFPELVDQIDMAALMVPAKDVGGDFYDIFRIDEDHFGFTIADVSGKGIPAAIFMAVSRTLIRATGIRGGSPSDCLTYSNKLLSSESVDCMFVTVFYGIYNIKTGEVTYCNAGHNPPVLGINDDCRFMEMESNAPIGLWPELDFVGEEVDNIIGYKLFIYTDGLNEAEDDEQQQFGEDRLLNILKHHNFSDCREVIEYLGQQIIRHRDGAEPNDDLTMMCLKVEGVKS